MASDVRASKKMSKTRKFSLWRQEAGCLCGATFPENAGRGITGIAEPYLRPPQAFKGHERRQSPTVC
jgi:hypothetical protein